ncbi:hypothetical protein BYT27DRAFT_7302171 [Phlegmacium glaucopus]|nr:hypothetical protein BYT27DRAFT_7302171 [Phlegmacium glaucopus]
MSNVMWMKSGNVNDLMIAPNNLNDTPSNRATCAIVGTVSPLRLFLEPHGNFNPTFEHSTFETSKTQFQLVSPTSYPEFNADFELAIKHVEDLQTKAITDGPNAKYFVMWDDKKKALKFSSPLFERRTKQYDPTDEEDWTNSYPMTERYKDAFQDIIPRWRVSPLPAYDTTKKFIKANDLETKLRDSLVLVYFELKHYAIKDKTTNSIGTNTFTALATQVTVLDHGAEHSPTPYKSRMLKGPTSLPQSPTKKKEQKTAVNAFHPAAASNSNIGVLDQSITDIHNPTLPQNERVLSKADGKKRALDEDAEATATDGETSLAEHPSPKKKKQNK